MSDPVNTYYLEMLTPRLDLRVPLALPMAVLVKVDQADANLNRELYLVVGHAWGWTDKADWPLSRWQHYVAGFGDGEQPAALRVESISTYVLQVAGRQAGYFELSQIGGDIEIRYFGLLAWAMGQGLGAALLSAAIDIGWQQGARRLWVHTCDLDHPAAYTNYTKRGFVLYKTEVEPH